MALINVNLSHIIVNDSNPHALFNEWYDDVKANGNLHVFNERIMNLATASKEGRVSNRFVLLQEVESDGYIFNTDKNGRKYKEIAEHPQVSAAIFWNYEKNGRYMQRQVRMEGIAVELNSDYALKQFERAAMNHKIRSMLCKQGDVVEREHLNERLDDLLEQVNSKKKPIKMEDSLVAFKITPNHMEFYHAYQDEIPDRVVFTETEGTWSFQRTEP